MPFAWRQPNRPFSSRNRARRSRRPLLEVLEQRLVPSVYTVNALTDSGSGSGLAGDLRYCITQADADPGSTIQFDGTVFNTNKTIALGGSELPVITANVTIQGPAAGVTLSGKQKSRLFEVGDGSHSPTVVFSNLTLTGGSVGGATYPANVGGAIYLDFGSVALSNCGLTSNTAGNEGGALYNNDGTVALTDCTVNGNSAGYGGGLFSSGSQLTLSNCTVHGNTADQSAGGLFSGSGGLTMSGCTVSDNTVTHSDNPSGVFINGVGGGVENDGPATLTDCTFADNAAGNVGGAVYNDSSAVLIGCTLSGSSAQEGGGFFNAAGGGATLVNCTVAGDTANYGGGLETDSFSSLLLVNCTVAGNSADHGGGLFAGFATATLNNTIVAGNRGGSGDADIEQESSTVTGYYDLVGTGGDGGLSGVANNHSQFGVADAGLAPLGNYGGPTPTMALLLGSPALGAGGVALAVEPTNNNAALTTDQRGTGFSRFRNNTVDIGAFESRGFTLTVTGGDNQQAVINSAFAQPLAVHLQEGSGGTAVNLPGVTVTFAGPASGAGLTSSPTATTDANGAASVSVTANGTLGSYVVTAAAGGVNGVSATFHLTNAETPSLVVNTTQDVVNSTDNLTSLREAILYADTLSGTPAITFDPTVFGTAQTITLNGTALPALSHSMTLTGLAAALTIDAQHASGIFVVNGGVTAALSGLTLANGFSVDGGALFNSGTVTLSNCTLRGNTATDSGGGFYNNQGTATLTGDTLSGNTAQSNGGGFDNNQGSATLSDCTLGGNSAFVGGGLYNYQGTVALTGGTLTDNTADGGGGLFNEHGTAALVNVTLSGNTATDPTFNGGGGLLNSGPLTLTGCTLSGNSAAFLGGGLLNFDSATLVNCTLAGNAAQYGGGLFVYQSTATLVNCTVADNAAPSGGSGLYNFQGTATLTNTIVAGNSAADVTNNGGTLAGDFDVVGTGDTAGLGAHSQTGVTDPKLAPLGDYGGPTQTVALRTGSPALAHGASGSGIPTTDQRGFARSGAYDVGAFQTQTTAVDFLVTTAADPGELGQQSLRGAIGLADALGGNATITFDTAHAFATPQTISLTAGPLPDLSANMTITGPGAGLLTIDAQHASGLVVVDAGVTAALSGLTLTHGTALVGGAVLNDGTLSLFDVALIGNTAGGAGGGLDNSGTVTLTDCTLSGNTAQFAGGGLLNQGAAALTNCTVSGNTANGLDTAGGIDTSADDPDARTTLLNCTVAGNTNRNASGPGGLFVGRYGPGQASVFLQNSIAANNSGSQFGTAGATVGPGTFVSLGHNLSSDASGNLTQPGDQQNTDPLLAALGYYGGATQTMPLKTGSPAIGAGATGGGLPTTDQRGFARTGASDLGAFQTQTTPVDYLVTTAADPGEFGKQSLRGAINLADLLGGNPTITFDSSVFATPQTISLNAGALPDLSKGMTITGPGASLVTVDARFAGSVIVVDGGVTAALSGVTLAHGTAPIGGGLLNYGTLTLTGVTLSGNTATQPSYGGGGLFNNGTATLTDCTISGNLAVEAGAGLFNFEGTLTLTGCTLSGNTALSTFGGGGLYNATATATLTECTLSGNSGYHGGAVVNAVNAGLTLTDCTVAGNSAQYGGGLLNVSTTTATLTGCTVAGNTAQFGGGVYELGGTVSLTDTLVAGNAAATDIHLDGGTLNGDYDVVGTGDTAGLGSHSQSGVTDPKLAPLGYYGGPTQTMALLPGSAALGAGTAGTGIPTTDQRGFARTTPYDIGAFQTQPASVNFVVTTAADPGELGKQSLRGAIALADVLGGNPTITFDNSVFATPQTITLTAGQLPDLSTGMTISGPGAAVVTVDARLASGILVVDSGVTAALSGLTLAHGSATAGGGINNRGTLTLTGCTLAGNSAFDGGGLYNYFATATLTGCTVSGNTAVDGGGLFNEHGMFTLVNVTLAGNTATDPNGNGGGGLLNSGPATLTGCTLSGNSAAANGGGLLNFGTAALADCTLAGNSAANGGGLYNFQGTATLTNSTLSDNFASSIGGGFFNETATATLVNCTLFGNIAASRAGGFENNTSSTATLTDCTLSGNSAPIGGGLRNNDSAVTLTNTIVAGNTAADQPDVNNLNGGTVTASHDVIGDGTGSGISNGTNGNQVGNTTSHPAVIDPGLAPLAYYGGPTQTMALLPNSPAIGAGTSGSGIPTTDQRGFARSGAIDVGAFQAEPAAVSFTVTTAADPGEYGKQSLRGAIALADVLGGNPTITFDASFNVPQTITLLGQELPAVLQNLTIQGPAAGVTVSGNRQSRVFEIGEQQQVHNPNVTLTNLTVTQGKALGSGIFANFGGGILDWSLGTLTLTNCTVRGNSAAQGGGIYATGTLVFTDCTLSGNTVSFSGAGLDKDRGTATLTNCTLTGNSAAVGGGIDNEFTAMTLINCTLFGNTAGLFGGGILDDIGSATLLNTIVAGNVSPSGPEVSNDGGGIATATYCLIGNGSGSGITATAANHNQVGTSASPIDPELAPLGYYGGDTQTMALLPTSPALGAGTSGPGIPTTDQRGFARTTPYDVGAFQSQPAAVSFVVTTAADPGEFGKQSLRGAINLADVLGGAPTITFDTAHVFATAQTISLTVGQLPDLSANMTIVGPGAALVTVDAHFASGILVVDAGVTAALSGLTLAHGSAFDGGAVYNSGTLTLTGVTLAGNSASDKGGGLYNNQGTLTLVNDILADNTAPRGGGLYNFQGVVSLTGDTLSGNTASVLGGGFYNYQGTATLANDTLSGNSAALDGGGMFGYFATFTLTACTLSGNSAQLGGGFANNEGTFTLTDGTLTGNTASFEGGGGWNYFGTVALMNVPLTGNSAQLGGGFFNNEGPATLTACTLSGNSAQEGGGFYDYYGVAALTGSALSGNSAQSGGGLFNDHGTVTLTGCTLSGNTAVTGGGGGENFQGVATLTDCTVAGNVVQSGDGGGINNSSGTLTLTGVTVTGNVASGGNGGGGLASTGTLTISRSTVRGNTALAAGGLGSGGGILLINGGSLTLTDSTVSGNSAVQSGGIGLQSITAVLTATLTNVTVAGNTSAGGSGIECVSSGQSASLTLTNCTVAGNSGVGIDTFVNAGTATVQYRNSLVAGNAGANFASSGGAALVSLGHNLSSDGTGNLNQPGDLPNTDPKLAPLGYYGGATQTMALFPGSPAIGAGATGSGVPVTDQRGFARSGAIDLGAFQTEPAAVNYVVTTAADPGEYGQQSLRGALALAELLGGNPTITFDPTVFATAQTITLTAGQLPDITASLTVIGPGAALLTIDAQHHSGLFTVGGATLALNGLTLANGSNSNGGALDVEMGTATLTDCALTGNTAATSGGAVFDFESTVTLTGCTLSDNFAQFGGGLATNNGAVTLADCTLAGNTAGTWGGAIFNSFVPLTLTNCTVSGNSAGAGGGLYNDDGEATLNNTILAGNTAGGATDLVNSNGGIVSGDYDVVGTGDTAGLGGNTQKNVTDLKLAPLGDYGGPTPTMALMPGSPALDHGNNNLASAAGLTTDQRGYARVANGTVDVGAFEYQGSSTITVNSTADGNARDIALTLREAILLTDGTLHPSDLTAAERAQVTGDPGLPGWSDTIVFAFTTAKTITLGGTELPVILHDVAIQGPSAALTVSGNHQSRVFDVGDFIHSPTVSISDLTVSGGSVSGSDGGGIRHYSGGTLTLTRVTVTGNTASGFDGGGGIASTGTLVIDRSTISGNTAVAAGGLGAGGGLLLLFGGSLQVTNSTVSGNCAFQGGGIGLQGYSAALTATLTNVTVSGNSAVSSGSGIECVASGQSVSLTLQNCTVAGNSGSVGILNDVNSGTSTLLYRNTLVAGNSGANFLNLGGTMTSLGHNLSSDSTGNLNQPGDLPNTNPLLAPLGNYGGPTQTMALLPGSPALNAGDASAPTTDQRGFGRVGAADIGAFEARGYRFTVTGGDNQSTPVNTAFAQQLTVNLQEGSGSSFVNLPGATVTFTGPSGNTAAITASPSAATDANGNAAVSVTANGTLGGPYAVVANTGGSGGLSSTFHLTNLEAPSLKVTTTSDAVNPSDGVTSLREAILYADTLSGNPTITFDPGVFGSPKAIVLGGTALPALTANVTIQGPAAGVTVSGNHQSGVFEVGDATHQPTVTLAGLTITGGSDVGGGGINLVHGGTLILTGCTLTGNSAGQGGGLTVKGLPGAPASATLTNCTVSGNSATLYGSGIESGTNDPGATATLLLQNCTVAGNMGGTAGILSFTNGGGSSTVKYRDTIVANNAGANFDHSFGGTLTSLGNNLSSDGTGNLNQSGDLPNTNPLLAPLGNYGGPTPTMALLPGSPALDAGTSTGAPATDQRGFGRVGAVDIGAFEARGYTLTVTGGDNQQTSINTAFAQQLSVRLQEGSGPSAVNLPTAQITFTGPATGAGITAKPTATTDAGGDASVSVTANGTVGCLYAVVASSGSASATFHLGNEELPSLVVTTAADTVDPLDGLTSLREAITYADTLTTDPTITFDPGVFGSAQTIALNGTPLPALSQSMTITGPAAALTIDAQHASGVFTINAGVTAALSGLTVANGFAPFGGGITNAGNLTLTGCTLSGNSAIAPFNYGSGGGLYNSGTAALANCTLTGNLAGALGGAAFNRGSLALTNCTVSGNSNTLSDSNGGAIQADSGTLTLADCTFTGNSSYAGGALFNFFSNTSITNCTFAGNFADVGGGVYVYSGSVTLANCTLVGNTTFQGGGLNLYSGTTTLNNSVVAGNTSTYFHVPDDIFNNAGAFSGGYNLIGTGGAGGLTNNVNGNQVGVADPGLAPLGNYGGPTQTMMPLPGSPTLAVGSVALAVDASGMALTTDQRGFARTRNNTVDVGAVESRGFNLTITGGDNQAVLANAPFPQALAVHFQEGTGSTAINLAGFAVTFTGPGSGAGITTAPSVTTDANGNASVNVTANGTLGAYVVTAATVGASIPFHLANVEAPSLVVTTTQDVVNPYDGKTSLREAITYADTLSGNPTITFDPGVFATSQTITLNGTELPVLTANMTIQGPAAALTVSGNQQSRVFEVGDGSHTPTVTICNLTVRGGSSSGDGGGLRENPGSTLTLSGVTVSGNTASGINGGGGIFDSRAALVIDRSTISGNTALLVTGGIGDGGGLLLIDGGSLALTNSTVSGNVAHEGGGIGLQSVTAALTATLTNVTVGGNTTAILGSGIDCGASGQPASLTLQNCTVAGNSGGLAGVYTFVNAGSSTVSYRNTIAANNAGANFASGGGTLTSLGHNLSSDGTGNLNQPGDLPNANPLLAPLGNYGGPTQTMALLPGSPAIDAGTSTGAPTTDQRGKGRVNAVDVGAFESQGFTLALKAGDNQSANPNTAFATALAVTVTANNAAEPVLNGCVRFTAPVSGPSGSFAGGSTSAVVKVAADGSATAPTFTANGTLGSYTVCAAAAGATPVVPFHLTNADTLPPTVTAVGLVNITTGGGASYGFTVTFADNVAVDVSTLKTGNVCVTGPGGFTVTPTFVGVDSTANGTPRTATYSFTPPGGFWDNPDNGTYTVSLFANQVKDTSGNAAAAGTLGSFQVNITTAFVAVVNGNLIAAGTPGNDLIVVTYANSQYMVYLNGVNFPAVPASQVTGAVVMLGYGGNDNLQMQGSATALLFGGTGNDTLTAGSGNCVLVGGDGSDQLHATTGNAVLLGGSIKAGSAYDSYAMLTSLAAQWGSAQHTMPTDLAGCITDGVADTYYGGTTTASATWALYDSLDSFVNFATGFDRKTLLS